MTFRALISDRDDPMSLADGPSVEVHGLHPWHLADRIAFTLSEHPDVSEFQVLIDRQPQPILAAPACGEDAARIHAIRSQFGGAL